MSVPVTVENNTAPFGTYCESPIGLSESMIVFTPSRSGWLYASVTSKQKSVGVIKLATTDGNVQITGTSKGVFGHPSFDRDIERRLGQVIPITLVAGQPQVPTVKLNRVGYFRVAIEEHYWKFQPIPTNLIPEQNSAGVWERWSEKEPVLNTFKDYEIVVEKPQTGAVLQMELYMTNAESASVSTTPIPATVVDPPVVVHNGVWSVYRWKIDSSRLESWAKSVLGNHQNNIRNVYIVLRNIKPPNFTFLTNGHPEFYRIRVEANNNWAPNPNLEGDSSAVNPIVVRRWCSPTAYEASAVDKMEKNHETFAISERLSHGDADYFLIWLQEGEHLNLTYRGSIPAAIDIGGAQREVEAEQNPPLPYPPVPTQYASVLNYIWPTWLADSDKIQGEGFVAFKNHPTEYNYGTGWRPVFWPTGALCQDDMGYNNCRNEFFAQRGYLWNYNHDLGNSNQIEVTDDNAVHLSLTAFITAPYIVRVRGQGNLIEETTGNLFGNWTNKYSQIRAAGVGNGHPYMLNINVGVNANRLRPHWQYLDPGENPAKILECSR